jgi:putative SOS response-associated peptidase YedK
MCGRFGFYDIKLFMEMLHQYELPFYEAEGFRYSQSYNIAPESTITVLFGNQESATLGNAHWGLIPHWAESLPKVRPINARAETLEAKPYFRHMLNRSHCLIPACGFYEWKRTPGAHSQPWYIQRRDSRPMTFAGLWDRWQPPGSDAPPIISCTIITAESNSEMLPIHNRMPVIVEPEMWTEWLRAQKAEHAKVLTASPAGTLFLYPVSPKVNNPHFDHKECIEPMAPDGSMTAGNKW